MEIPTYSNDHTQKYSDGKASNGDPLFMGFTASQLVPESEVVTVDQIANRLKRKANRDAFKKFSTKKPTALKHKYEMLPVGSLEVDQGAYQRLEHEGTINDIVTNFQEEACLPLVVCRRMYNGKANVIADGQERAVALRVRNKNQIGCIVYEVNSPLEEAMLFYLLNNRRKSIPTPVIHKDKVLLGDPKELALAGAIKAATMSAGEKNGNLIVKGTTRLHVIATMYADGGKPNYALIRDALIAYRTIWPLHKEVHLYLVAGIAFLLYAYRQCPGTQRVHQASAAKISATRLATLVIKEYKTPKELVQHIAKERPAEQDRQGSDAFYAMAVFSAYNSHTRGPGCLAKNVLRDALAWRRADK